MYNSICFKHIYVHWCLCCKHNPTKCIWCVSPDITGLVDFLISVLELCVLGGVGVCVCVVCGSQCVWLCGCVCVVCSCVCVCVRCACVCVCVCVCLCVWCV